MLGVCDSAAMRVLTFAEPCGSSSMHQQYTRGCDALVGRLLAKSCL
jgi:hypothetical protein